MKSSSRKRNYLLWLGVGVGALLVIAIVGLLAIRFFVAAIYHIEGPSMAPAFPAGSRSFVVKTREAKPGDPVVFESPSDGMEVLKRIVAGDGTTVAARDGRLHIDGKAVPQTQLGTSRDGLHRCVAEKIGDTVFVTAMHPDYRMEPFETTLLEGAYFMLGDRRDRSNDSRSFGPVQGENIVGIAELSSAEGDTGPCGEFELPTFETEP